VQFTSILSPCKYAKLKNGFGWEIGAFLKGANSYSGYKGSEYKGYPVKDAVGCHFRRYYISPPFMLRSYECGGFSHALLWRYLSKVNLTSMASSYDKHLSVWIDQLENLKEVKSYVNNMAINTKGVQDKKKWGSVYGLNELIEYLE